MQQPVPKVSRMARQFDAFENAGLQKRDMQQASARSATPQPKAGATNVTQFSQHRDAFESATRKPVELAPKPPPSFKAAIPVFRFR